MTMNAPHGEDSANKPEGTPYRVRNLRTGVLIKDAISRTTLTFSSEDEATTTAESLNRFAAAGNKTDRYEALKMS